MRLGTASALAGILPVLAIAGAACDSVPPQAHRQARPCAEWTSPYEEWVVSSVYLVDQTSAPPVWRALGGALLVPDPNPAVEPGHSGSWADALADNLVGAVERRLVELGRQADDGGLGDCPAIGLHSAIAPEEVTVGAELEAGADGRVGIRVTSVTPRGTRIGGPSDLQPLLLFPWYLGGWLPLGCPSSPARMEVLVRVPTARLAGIHDWRDAYRLAHNREYGLFVTFPPASGEEEAARLIDDEVIRARCLPPRTPKGRPFNQPDIFGASCLRHCEEWTRIYEAGEGWPLPYP